MRIRRVGETFLLAVALMTAIAGRVEAFEQEGGGREQPAARSDVNYDVHLHVLVSGEAASGVTGTPPSLEGVVRQLKASLPSAEYALSATFINRVKDGGRLEVKSAGPPVFSSTPPEAFRTSFFNYLLGGIRLADDASSRKSIEIREFRLSLRVPVQTGIAKDDKGASQPIIQYEDVGLNTQFSVREGEPTLAGTLNTGKPGQHFAFVVTIKRDASK